MKKGRTVLRTTTSGAQALGSGTMTGFRLAQKATELTFEGLLMLYDALQSEEVQEEAEAEEAVVEEDDIEGQDDEMVNSSPPITVNSSPTPSTQRSKSRDSSDLDIDEAWMRQRGRSRSQTPDRA